MQVLLFANGEIRPGVAVERAQESAEFAHVLCADGGAVHARQLGLTPQTIIGDMDSLTESDLAEFAAAGARIQRFPAEKDETDLELALRWCAENRAAEITILGALGGLIDQTLANICLLALPALEGISVRIVDGEQTLRLLQPGRRQLEGCAGDTVSLLPLCQSVRGVVSEGLQYALDGETLEFGPARGISNVMTAAAATIEFAEGRLLLVHTKGRAK